MNSFISFRNWSLSLSKGILITLASALLMGCGSTRRAVEIADHATHDTIYLNHQLYDSIYVHDSSTSDYRIGKVVYTEPCRSDTAYLPRLGTSLRVDTVYRNQTKTDYKYRLLRDTLYKTQVDTIPVIKTVEVTKTERYVPTIYKWSLGIVITLVLILILYIVWKIKF